MRYNLPRMRMRNLQYVILIVMALAVVLCGCTYTASEPVTIPYDYNEVTALIKTYEDSYREFVANGEGEVYAVTANGVTPLGASCRSVYTLSSDGAFESCSLTVEREVEQHDEYFNIGDGIMMFVRSYIDQDGLIVINKYITLGGILYYINDTEQKIEEVTNVTDVDCFVTFDQVRRVYSEQPEVTETAPLSV